MDKHEPSNEPPHIVFLPFPAQGHVKSLLLLAKLLTSRSGFGATFVNSDLNQSLLESSSSAGVRDRFPNLRFASVPDGLPPGHPRNGSRRMDVIDSTRDAMRPAFRELLVDLRREYRGRVYVVSDVFMSFAVEIGEELRVPVIPFQSFGAYSTWVCLHLFKLVENGVVPFPGDVDMEEPLPGIPGLDGILSLRRLDLPASCKCKEADDPYLQFLIQEMATLTRSPRIIINTFDALESPIVSEFRTTLFPRRMYCVGPLHGLLETFETKETTSSSSSPPSSSSIGMLKREDRSCLAWLDTKPPRSVIYVSLGSWAGLSLDQLTELRHGLVNSEKWFLWVIRRDLIVGESNNGGKVRDQEVEIMGGIEERGCIVEWAPQEAVLRHPSVGGFFTHSGWNSTLEGIFAGVPMICWSQLAEQPVNSRCVGEKWKVGVDVKGASACNRETIERTVRDVMERKREDLRRSMDEVAKLARESVTEGGTSYGDFLDLIEDLRDGIID